MRRRIPFLLLAGLTLLTLIAAAISLQASPTISYFGTPQKSSPEAVANLDRAVNATLRARSLTMRQGGTSTVYEAPDLTEFHFGPQVQIAIGKRTFSSSGYDASSSQWFEVLPDLSLSISPVERLKEMLNLPGLQQHGTTFVSSLPAYANTTGSGVSGKATTLREVIRIKDGFVSSQTYTVLDTSPNPPESPKCKSCSQFEEFGPAETTSFVDINSSPAIAIPPKAERVIPKVVSMRRLHGALLKIYEWLPTPTGQASAGYELLNRSGRSIGGGSGSIGAFEAPVRYALEPNGGGGGGPGSWMDYTLSIGSNQISRVRITRGHTILDSMTTVGTGTNRFVILVIKTPSLTHGLIQGLNSSGKVVVSRPLNAFP